ncbi:hypothetical protein AB0O42_35660 [Streptomyces sp. NPDC089922]|uniref:telomere-protecting terminal protein Tpg n=1 Tax=Streptomyces sp. NPDC089922 TaxID=3155189 RepID=UPI0034351A0E
MEAKAKRRWQPLVRKRARDRVAQLTGLTIETRARFGFTAAPGTTDDGRMRRLTQHPARVRGRALPGPRRRALEAELQALAAEGLQQLCFKMSF